MQPVLNAAEPLPPMRVNEAATQRAAARYAGAHIEGAARVAWLARAIACMDLTTLSGDDTERRVARLCAKARRPLRADIAEKLGLGELHCAAVCVYPTMVAAARRALGDGPVRVASVATGFPAGLMPLKLRLDEIRAAVADGAHEIDVVITRGHALRGDWVALHDEIAAMREACGTATLKVILGTGDLGNLGLVARASQVACAAGADFIKTSTGKEAVNATLPVSLVMLRVLRDLEARRGIRLGFKPAGGLRTAQDALDWLDMTRSVLGSEAVTPNRFRIGASSLLTALERDLGQIALGVAPRPTDLSLG